MRKFFYLLLACIFFVSCRKPPENAKVYNLFSFIETISAKLMECRGMMADAVQKELLAEFEQFVLIAEENSVLTVIDTPYQTDTIQHNEHPIAHSLGNHLYQLNCDFFITDGKRRGEFLYSINGSDWYSSLPRKMGENIFLDYNIETDRDSKTVLFSGGVFLGRAQQHVPGILGREILELQPQMCLFKNGKKEKIRLSAEYILHFPAMTQFLAQLKIHGNLVNSVRKDEKDLFYFMRTLYLYLHNKFLSVSFDYESWNISLLDFQIGGNFCARTEENPKLVILNLSVDIFCRR